MTASVCAVLGEEHRAVRWLDDLHTLMREAEVSARTVYIRADVGRHVGKGVPPS
jgi:hypothetical protein